MGSVPIPFQQNVSDVYAEPASARSSAEAAQTVPSGDAASSGGTQVGTMSSDSLMRQIQRSNEQIQQLSKQAATPVMLRSAGQLPSSMTREIGAAPQSPNQGRPTNKGQAMADMIRSAGNAVSKVITAEKQNKQNQLVDSATKLFTSQQSVNEAQQAYDAAKASGNTEAMEVAKTALDRSQVGVDQILNDKKTRDMIAKGLHFNNIEPEENKTENHEAMKKALENAHTIQERKAAMIQEKQRQQAARNAQGVQNFKQAFEKSQPTTLGPNTAAQGQLAAVQAQRKELMETLKVVLPEQIKSEVEMSKEEHADARRVAEDNAALNRTIQEDNTKLHISAAEDVRSGRENASRMAVAQMQEHTTLALRALEQRNPLQAIAAFQLSSRDYQTAIDNHAKTRQTLGEELDGKGGVKPSPARAAEIRSLINRTYSDDNDAKSFFDNTRTAIAKGMGIKLTDPQLQVPTVQVGDGATSGAKPKQQQPSPDIDPRTGQPFAAHHNAISRALVKGVYGTKALGSNIATATGQAVDATGAAIQGTDSAVQDVFDTIDDLTGYHPHSD